MQLIDPCFTPMKSWVQFPASYTLGCWWSHNREAQRQERRA